MIEDSTRGFSVLNFDEESGGISTLITEKDEDFSRKMKKGSYKWEEYLMGEMGPLVL